MKTETSRFALVRVVVIIFGLLVLCSCTPDDDKETWETSTIAIATYAQMAIKKETGSEIKLPHSSDIIITRSDLYYAIKFTARTGEVGMSTLLYFKWSSKTTHMNSTAFYFSVLMDALY